MAELIGGSGYDDVQATEPTSPSIGDTWLDTNPNGDADSVGKIYADLGGGADWQVLPVQDELQSGRTRELLMLLQDKPVPEVQDPANLSVALSNNYTTDGDGDYVLRKQERTLIDDFEDDDITVESSSPWTGWNDPDNNLRASTNRVNSGTYAGSFGPFDEETFVNIQRDTSTSKNFEIAFNPWQDTSDSSDVWYLRGKDGSNIIWEVEYRPAPGEQYFNGTLMGSYQTGTDGHIFHTISHDTSSDEITLEAVMVDGTVRTQTEPTLDPNNADITEFEIRADCASSGNSLNSYVDDVSEVRVNTTGSIVDVFAAPTAEPTGFKAWNALRARDVTTGGSTSADPVEFVIRSNNITRPEDGVTSLRSDRRGLRINPNTSISRISYGLSKNTSGASTGYITDSDGNVQYSTSIQNRVASFTGIQLDKGAEYWLVVDNGGAFAYDVGRNESTTYPITSDLLDVIGDVYGTQTGTNYSRAINNIAVPQTTSRIPKSQIADEPFNIRNRVYTESAGSNGQSDYQIATTGGGGHFGIPVLTVVSVKKNGSVLDSANWSFDGDTTVTIDTSNVTITSGDTIDIKYDFDVFDSTLQIGGYLNIGDTSETSPSISHFRYEYVI